jgi:Transglycosylase SLT domain
MITWWGFILRMGASLLLAANIAFIIDHLHSPIVITRQVAMTNAGALDVAAELMDKKSFQCLKAVITVESHDNAYAKNPHSTARGVGQLLASTYRNLGLKHSNDPRAQLVAMLAYVSERYGSGGACSALQHERKYNWF